MNPKVAIIVVNWNRREDTLECLDSLKGLDYPDYRIILVDNGSSDGSVEAVAERFPEAQIIRSESNLRFAGGNNLGLKDVLEKGDDFCLLLNNDTTVEPDFLNHLIEAVNSNTKVGLAAPKILYQHRPDVIWFAGGILKPNWGYVRHYGLRQLDDGRFDTGREVSFLTGCCLLIRRELLYEIGLLDEGFYLYSEDADYCLRAVKAGYSLIYEPKAHIYHKVSQSTGGAYHPKKWLRRYQSLFRLVEKHSSLVTLPLFLLNFIWENVSAYLSTLFCKLATCPPKNQTNLSADSKSCLC